MRLWYASFRRQVGLFVPILKFMRRQRGFTPFELLRREREATGRGSQSWLVGTTGEL
jgi:hypothetical protein